VAAKPGLLSIANSLVNSGYPIEKIDEQFQLTATRLINDPDSGKQFNGHRLSADQAHQKRDWPLCISHCHEALNREPSSPGARRVLASALMETKDFAAATHQLAVLADAEAEPGSDTWDLLTAATCAGDWATVRTRAELLGMSITEGTGPIDEEWSQCGILLPGNDGMAVWSAVRTGPVTARVVEVAHPQMPMQHFGSVVVFNPAPVNGADREEQGDNWMPIFPTIQTLVTSEYNTWTVDGVYPGLENWTSFRDTLRADGWGAWVATWETYEIIDSATDEKHEGLFAFIASPPHSSPSQVYDRITELSAAWAHQLAFKQLADAAGHGVERHAELIRRYQL
jgi:hypothetical protein